MRRSPWAWVVFLSLTGCMTLGRPFPVGLVPSIELNKTTKKDLVQLFGEPYRTGIDDGDETWTYVHYRFNVFGDQKTRDLFVKFNKGGTVKSYSFNTSVPGDKAGLQDMRK